MRDEVDRLVEAWQRERSDLDLRPMEVLSRVTRLARHLDRPAAPAFAEHELESWEFDVLSALRRAGTPYELSPGRLLRETLVTSGTMTNRVDRLAARGWVERLPTRTTGAASWCGSPARAAAPSTVRSRACCCGSRAARRPRRHRPEAARRAAARPRRAVRDGRSDGRRDLAAVPVRPGHRQPRADQRGDRRRGGDGRGRPRPGRDGLRAAGAPDAGQRRRRPLQRAAGHVSTLGDRGVSGIKVVGDFVPNYEHGLPSELGLATLYDPSRACPARSWTPRSSPRRAPGR